MSDATARLGLPYILTGQAQKEVTHNEALNLVDALLQAVVLDRHRAAPPDGPAEGDCYIVAAGGTGAWAGQDGRLAAWYGGWLFATPGAGWTVWVADESAALRHDGAGWAPASGEAGPVRQVVHGFAFGDASPAEVTTVAAGRTLLSVAIAVQTPFDGIGAALAVGDAATPDRFLAAGQVNPGAAALYVATPALRLGADTPLRLSITPGAGATAGAGLLILDIQR